MSEKAGYQRMYPELPEPVFEPLSFTRWQGPARDGSGNT